MESTTSGSSTRDSPQERSGTSRHAPVKSGRRLRASSGHSTRWAPSPIGSTGLRSASTGRSGIHSCGGSRWPPSAARCSGSFSGSIATSSPGPGAAPVGASTCRWWRWHHVLGLTAGLFLLGWILSGWLSMDHGRLFSRGGASATATAAMAGMPLATRAEGVSLAALAGAGPASSIELRALAGRSFLHVKRQAGPPDILVPGQDPQDVIAR